MSEHFVNFHDQRQKHLFIAQIRELDGPHRVTVVKMRKRRSDRQNRYYWPCFVQIFGDYLRAQGEHYTDQHIHEMFKLKFLRKSHINKETGEVIADYTLSTTELNTKEFNEYLDSIAAWLAQTFQIVVPEASEYHEQELVTQE